MNRSHVLRRRLWWLTWLFIAGLFVSGATAIPLTRETNLLARTLGADHGSTGWGQWLVEVREALLDTEARHPYLFYGTDWLAFGHFVIAIAFVGALRDPVRNRWLYDFGLIACALVVPYAMIFGGLRGIPAWWRLIDCSFGVFGAVPLWLCRCWAKESENLLDKSPHPARH